MSDPQIVPAVLAIAISLVTLVMMVLGGQRIGASADSARRDADRAQDIVRRMRERS